MKKIFVLLFVLLSSITYCQTLSETISWIGRNSHMAEQVKYINGTKKLQLISIRQIPGHVSSFVQEINPADVTYVSTIIGDDGWQTIKLSFKNSVKVYSYIEGEGTKRIAEETQNRTGLGITIKCDKEMILKFKKAYINLFKVIGVTVKDGDLF